jgi:leishmanolysin
MTRSAFLLILVWIASSWSATAYRVDDPPSSNSNNLRSNNSPRWERVNAIRRVYGPDNRSVRREIDLLENRMERYKTGFNGDPDHRIEYQDHPYDPETRRRQRQLSSSSSSSSNSSNSTNTTSSSGNSNSTLVSSANLFKPMRFTFYTQALQNARDGTNDAKIDWYINEILPKTAAFWSSALKVVPISGNLKISAAELDSRTYCGDSVFTAVPSSHMSVGVPNTDLLLYVSASSDTRFCPPRTLAVAVPCNFDQFDRPIAGAINVCLNNIVLQADGTASAAVMGDYTDVTIHEVGHVLGLSSNSYRFYWDPNTGLPRTPRPFTSSTVTCVDGSVQDVILPASNTLQFFNNSNDGRHAYIVTEKVRAVARNQFDCQSVPGGQLENQQGGTSCVGDHWDERLYYPEAMSAVISPTSNIFTSLTLALMEDSGWYKANYTVSKMSPWGLGAGCDFVNGKCLIAGSSGPTMPSYSKGFFCNKQNDKGCSPELSTKLACTVVDYYYMVPQNLPPANMQYFSSSATLGGPQMGDYCPVYGSPYKNLGAEQLSCKNPNNADAFNLYSEVYGSDSLCFTSNMGEGLCYRTACVQDEMSLRINVRGQWLTW